MKSILTEGKHWPEDYIKTAYNIIKQSAIGKQSWYKDEYVKQDINTFVEEFAPLSHKNSNLGFFVPIAKWFVEYAGSSQQKYQKFIERKLNEVIKALLKIRNDKTYDTRADEIKKMSFTQFEKLMDEVNAKLSDDVIQTSRSDAKYEVTPIYSYDELHDRYGGPVTGYKGQSEWCHTNGKSTYESWTKDGSQMFFVIQQDGWEKIQPLDPQKTSCYDAYGMSLIAILVDVKSNKLLNSTSRWNHIILPKSGAADTMFESWQQLNAAVGIDVESICRDECKDLKRKLEKYIQDANAEVEKILKTVDVIDEDTIPETLKKHMTNVVIPDNVTSIGNYAFYNCSRLTSVTIGNGVTSIGEYAFADCSGLTSVTIPDSVTSIGYYAFNGCSWLGEVVVPQSVCNSRMSSVFPSAYQSITNVVISDGVTNIANFAFYGCTNLTSVTIPDSVTSIGDGAFYGCTNITSVTIPDSVTNIGSRAFYGCSRLTRVTICDGVTNIRFEAFAQCSSMTNLLFKGKTLEEVQSMRNYPWGINDTSIIKAEKSLHESKHDPMVYYWAHMLDDCFRK